MSKKSPQQKGGGIFAGFVLLWCGDWCIMTCRFAAVGLAELDYVQRPAASRDFKKRILQLMEV